jgi:hypothetical protein
MSIVPAAPPGPIAGALGHFAHHDWLEAAVELLDSTLTADTGWVAITVFASPWTGSTVGYRKIGNVVRLRGNVTRPSGVVNTPFTLPVGFRPAQSVNLIVREASSLAAVAVGSSGAFVVGSGYTNTDTLYLDSIAFLSD